MKKLVNFVPVILGLTALLLASFAAFAQEEAGMANSFESAENQTEPLLQFETITSESSLVTEVEQIAPFACTTNDCVYMPLLNRVPELKSGAVIHRSNCSADFSVTPMENGERINLGGGQREVYFGMFAEGYSGSTYETRFLINGSVAGTDSGILTSNSQPIVSLIYTYGTVGTTGCRLQIPSGTNTTVEFWIDGKLVTQLSAVIN